MAWMMRMLWEKDCVDLTCVSVHASSAIFANCVKVSVGLEGDIITYGADRSYRTDNTNGENWT